MEILQRNYKFEQNYFSKKLKLECIRNKRKILIPAIRARLTTRYMRHEIGLFNQSIESPQSSISSYEASPIYPIIPRRTSKRSRSSTSPMDAISGDDISSLENSIDSALSISGDKASPVFSTYPRPIPKKRSRLSISQMDAILEEADN